MANQSKQFKKPPVLIGNEIDAATPVPAGSGQFTTTRHALVQTSEVLRLRSAQLDEIRSRAEANVKHRVLRRPPAKPTPKPASEDDLPLATTISNNILLVAILESIAVLAPDQYLNYAFGLYGLYVLVRKISSRKVFGAALLSLILIPIVTAFHRQNLADSFAVMTFYFLLIGLVRSVFELRDDRVQKRQKA